MLRLLSRAVRHRRAIPFQAGHLRWHGFTGGYQSVRRFVRGLRGAGSPDARVIIETQPGVECQVDYGTGPRRATSLGYVR